MYSYQITFHTTLFWRITTTTTTTTTAAIGSTLEHLHCLLDSAIVTTDSRPTTIAPDTPNFVISSPLIIPIFLPIILTTLFLLNIILIDIVGGGIFY